MYDKLTSFPDSKSSYLVMQRKRTNMLVDSIWQEQTASEKTEIDTGVFFASILGHYDDYVGVLESIQAED
jgi:hypothetical protein